MTIPKATPAKSQDKGRGEGGERREEGEGGRRGKEKERKRLQQQVRQPWPRAKARQAAGGAGATDKSFILASGLAFNWFNICTVRSHKRPHLHVMSLRSVQEL